MLICSGINSNTLDSWNQVAIEVLFSKPNACGCSVCTFHGTGPSLLSTWLNSDSIFFCFFRPLWKHALFTKLNNGSFASKCLWSCQLMTGNYILNESIVVLVLQLMGLRNGNILVLRIHWMSLLRTEIRPSVSTEMLACILVLVVRQLSVSSVSSSHHNCIQGPWAGVLSIRHEPL